MDSLFCRMPTDLWLFSMDGGGVATGGNQFPINAGAARHWAFWLGTPGAPGSVPVGELYHIVKDGSNHVRFQYRGIQPWEIHSIRNGTIFQLTADLTYRNFQAMCQEVFNGMEPYNAFNNNCQDWCCDVLDRLHYNGWIIEHPSQQMKDNKFTRMSDYVGARVAGVVMNTFGRR